MLINNAGSIFSNRAVTVDGLERTFALNHMAYFVLTHRLRECLIASAPARIVNKASSTHQGQYLDFNDLQMEKHYRARTAYGRSKLANILFTRELARGLAGTGARSPSSDGNLGVDPVALLSLVLSQSPVREAPGVGAGE